MAVSASAAEGGQVPTYQYACTECGERLEVVQKFTDDPLTVCSACGGKLRKLFSAVGIVFKGSGFYRTDSRNGSKDGASKDGAKDGAKDKEKKASGAESPAASGGSEAKADPGSGAPAGDGKPAKKTDSAGSATPSSGSKVA
jgi:putative FmdB family regulatory protein